MKGHLEIKRQKRVGERSPPGIPTRKSQQRRPLGVARMDAIREKIPFVRPDDYQSENRFSGCRKGISDTERGARQGQELTYKSLGAVD